MKYKTYLFKRIREGLKQRQLEEPRLQRRELRGKLAVCSRSPPGSICWLWVCPGRRLLLEPRNQQNFGQPLRVGVRALGNQRRPHRRQPTRLLGPWDFPGKSTGVGCHCSVGDFNKKNFITAQSSCYIETGDNAKTENSLNGKF